MHFMTSASVLLMIIYVVGSSWSLVTQGVPRQECREGGRDGHCVGTPATILIAASTVMMGALFAKAYVPEGTTLRRNICENRLVSSRREDLRQIGAPDPNHGK